MIHPLIDTQEDLVQRLHTAEETIREMLDQQTQPTYTTVYRDHGGNGAGTISGFKTRSKGLYGSRNQGFRLKQLSLNKKKRKVHFENIMPVAPPRCRRMVEEVEAEDDVVLEEEQSSLLPPPPANMLHSGNPGYTENLELSRERVREEKKAIPTSRPRLKAPPPRSIRPQLTLIPANLRHKTKRAPPIPSSNITPPTPSSNIRVTAEHHSDDQPNIWTEDRG